MQGAQEWLLLVAVYRPPVDAWSLEFPAGMIDPGETPVEAGRRELLEETGFTARCVLFFFPSNVTRDCPPSLLTIQGIALLPF